MEDWLRRPEVTWNDLPEEFQRLPGEIAEAVEADVKYSGYVARDLERIATLKDMEGKIFPKTLITTRWLVLKKRHDRNCKKSALEPLARPHVFRGSIRPIFLL